MNNSKLNHSLKTNKIFVLNKYSVINFESKNILIIVYIIKRPVQDYEGKLNYRVLELFMQCA